MRRLWILNCVIVVLSAGAAQAQSKSPAPVSTTDPAQTTASYGDWTLRCVRTGDNGQGPRVCELVQGVIVQGQQQPVAQLAIGYDKADLRFTLLVPPAISLSKTPAVTPPAGGSPQYDLAWRRCLPQGCFADAMLTAEMLKGLRVRTEPLQVSYKDALERDTVLPVSVRGITAALDALAKEPRP
jgi:invasion protein IalB